MTIVVVFATVPGTVVVFTVEAIVVFVVVLVRVVVGGDDRTVSIEANVSNGYGVT